MLDETVRQKQKIEKALHCGDEKQLEVIFSDAQRLLVEASPDMQDKNYDKQDSLCLPVMSYQIKENSCINFQCYAAYKIKKDVAEQLPSMISLKIFIL